MPTPIVNYGPSLALNAVVVSQGEPPQPSGDRETAGGAIGMVRLLAGEFVPAGMVAMDGRELSTANFTRLTALLSNTYGGDGTSTFAVPNLAQTAVLGVGQGRGLDNYTLGERTAIAGQVELGTAELPIDVGGEGRALDSRQPTQALRYVIDVRGPFPPGEQGYVANDFIGAITLTAATEIPGGYMECDGRLLPISQFTTLFTLLGTTYGGDGKSTFALPDLRGRVAVGASESQALGEVRGAEAVTLTTAQLPFRVGGQGEPVSYAQPSLGVTYLISRFGTQVDFRTDPNTTVPSSQPVVGEVMAFAGSFAPGGWLLAEGQLLRIDEFEQLFLAFGTTYGGDGETTFALPDLRGRTVVGVGGGVSLGRAFGDTAFYLTSGQTPLIAGGSQADYLIGSRDDEIYNAGDGDDVLEASGGNDILRGQGGGDTVDYARFSAGVTIDLSLMGPQLVLMGKSDTLIGVENLNGGFGNDVLIGDGADNALDGRPGRDFLTGGGGDDVLTGGSGRDVFYAAARNQGTDRVTDYTPGEDSLRTIGSKATSAIFNQNDGTTTISYAGGTLVVNGNVPLSAIVRSAWRLGGGDDVDAGTFGDDLIYGNGGADQLAGGEGDDTLTGDAGDDVLSGGAGKDALRGGAGEDTLDGGAGEDTLGGDAGNDMLTGGAGRDTLRGDDGNDALFGGDDADRVEGGQGNDTLDGEGGNDTLVGGAGNDRLRGDEGNDRLDGGTGADDVDGGEGSDTYVVADAFDTVVDTGTSGIDTVEASVTFMSSGAIERLFAQGGSALNLTGDTGNNVIRGNDNLNRLSGGDGDDVLEGNGGNDVLTGGAGRDRLDGGLGADSLTGGTGSDLFVFAFEAGSSRAYDTITDFSSAEGDRIDLRLIDPSATPMTFVGLSHPQAPAFVGGGVNSVLYLQGSGHVQLYADLDGNGLFDPGLDFYVRVNNVSSLTARDFAF